MFLTPEELQILTGYKRASRQIRWLQENGIRHWVNGHGLPVVPRPPLGEMLERSEPSEPNLGALE